MLRVWWLAAFELTMHAVSARADIYECRRADGTTHYTNLQPSSGRCHVIIREARTARRATTGPPRPRPSPSVGANAGNSRMGYDDYIREAAALYQLPEAFLRAVMRVESNGSPAVVSVDGAMGLMQLMPRTAAAMGVLDPWNPRENILGGARYLRILANKFNGDLVLTIAAYNAGEAAVERYGGVPPYDETRRYVQRVLEHYYALRAASASE